MDITHPQPLKLIGPTEGLNNRVPSVELKDTELSECHNFVIDEYGHQHKRPGFVPTNSGRFHSLPQEANIPYVAKDRDAEKDAALFLIASDFTLTGVRSGLTQCARISYWPYASRIYYMNGFEKGYLIADKSFPWVKGPIDIEDLRQYSDPPVGSHIAFYLGRMLVAVDDVLYFSALYRPDLFELHRNFVRFPARIVMVRPVENGIFISTTESIYFIKGEISDIIQSKLVSVEPALEWSDSGELIEASQYGLNEPTLCAIWVGRDGVNWGLPTGDIVKVNNNKIKYPNNTVVGAGILYGRSYIHSIS